MHSVYKNFPGGNIYRQSLKFINFTLWFLFPWFMSHQDYIYPGHQFLNRKRFYHIIINASFKSLKFVIFFSFCRQHQRRNILYLPYSPICFITIHLRHHNVHNNQVKILLPAQFQCLPPISCTCHIIPLIFRKFPDPHPD